MTQKPYIFTFAMGGLQAVQSMTIVEQYAVAKNWDDVRRLVDKMNLLQGKTSDSNIRRANEIISRLRMLDKNHLELLPQASSKNRLYILWLAMCRRYQFIADFAVEVMTPKALSSSKVISLTDYESYFDHKTMLYPYIDNLSDSTKKKAASRIFTSARQANILDGKGNVLPIVVVPEIHEFFANLSSEERQYFPGLFS